MFDNLTDRLSSTLKKLKGQGRLTEDNIKDALREVRMAFLEADVSLSVVTDFIERVKEGASYDDAAQDVYKVLFDYGDQSSLDTSIRKVIPFWTWTRKNVPLQF